MLVLKKSESTAARRRVPIHLVDATDGITPETGEASGQPQYSKNGGTWTSTSATLSAVGNGFYYVELTAGELDTEGWIAIRYKSANTAEFQVVMQVVAYDPFDATTLGLTNLDATVSSRSSLTSANVETAVATKLNTAIPGSPTADSINERIKTLDDAYTATRGGYLDRLDAAVTTRASPTDVNTQVCDVLKTDTVAEQTAGAPTATPTLEAILCYLYEAWRNKQETTNAVRTLYKDDGSTPLCASAWSDDGSTQTRGEWGAP